MVLKKGELSIKINDKIDRLEVLFNPEEYSISTQPEIATKKDINGNDEYESSGFITETLSMTLIFDAYDFKDLEKEQLSVRGCIEKLENLIDNKDDSSKSIPTCEFAWGEFKFEGVLKSLSQTYTRFSPNGIPLRASVKITIERTVIVETVAYKAEDHPTVESTQTNAQVSLSDKSAESNMKISPSEELAETNTQDSSMEEESCESIMQDNTNLEEKYSNLSNPAYEIMINNKKLEDNPILLSSVEVDTSTTKADSFTLKVSNAFDNNENKFMWIEDFFTPGYEVEIKLGYGDVRETVFNGYITSVSFGFPGKECPEVIVSGMDASFKMMKGIKSFSWTNMKYSEVVENIASKYKFKAKTIEATEILYEIIEQSRMTDYQFIAWMAERSNFEFFITGKELFFRKPLKDKKPEIKLEVGKYKINLQVDQDIGDQVGAVTVRGWDHKKKEEFEDKVQDVEVGDYDKAGAEFIRELVGGDTTEYIYSNEDSKDSAGKRAKMILNSSAMNFITGKGEWCGVPEIIAGKYVKFSGAGENIDKLYYITSANHIMDESGYRTSFEFGGSRNSSIKEHIGSNESNSFNLNSRIFGVTIGVVTNNKDPEKMGRVKLKLPLRECQNETNWARVATLMTGKEMGSFFLPEVGDEVLVAFNEGDVSRPFVIGALWNSKEGPPLTNEDGKNNIRKLKSRSGNEVIFYDEDGKESIEIKTKAGQTIKMEDDSEGKLTLRDKSGKNLLEIVSQNNQIILKADMKIDIQAGTSKITMDGTKNSIELESSMEIKLKAQKLDIEGGTINIKSDGPLALKGAIVKLN